MWCSWKKWEQLFSFNATFPFLISVQQFICTLVLVHEWTQCEFPIQTLPPTATGELETAARPFHMQFIIVSNTVYTQFSLWKWMFARCWYSASVHTHVRTSLRLWQSNENKTALSHKHAVALSGPEIVPNVIVNHQQRRRRNVLLSLRWSHALGHGCYFIIPPGTAMVNLFHYVAMSVHVLAACTCMLLRSGFISSAGWVSLRPEIKLWGLRAQSLRLTTARELVVIQAQRLERNLMHAG